MSISRTLRRSTLALMLLVALLCQATWTLAGTTGSLNGVVTDEKGAPVVGASVQAVAASGSYSAVTDSRGRFNLLSLAPDTYTVTVSKNGYASTSTNGVVIFADQSQNLTFTVTTSLRTIAHVSSQAAGNLVKSGTTSDVYSVNASTQAAVSAIGGGANLDSAYSAIYSQPGVTSQIGVYGFGQVYYIRGSSYSQIGYEFDGVPVNRAFDNYNANSLSSLGSAETEIYTGGSPAGGTSATLGGYINQVIKTGTFPGYANATLGAGYPGFYHKAGIEAGGATPDRLFSWYVGIQGANQSYNVGNDGNFADQPTDGSGPNGISSTTFNPVAGIFNPYPNGPYSTCGYNSIPKGAATFSGIPVCDSYAPWAGSGFLANGVNPWLTLDRENVINFHFGIPHKNDGGRDDVQLLYDNFAYHQSFSDFIGANGGLPYMNASLPDWGGANGIAAGLFGVTSYNGENGPYSNLCGYNAVLFGPTGCATTGGSTLRYADTTIFAPGTTFGQLSSSASAIPYLSPNTPPHAVGDGIPTNSLDGIWNDGSVVKLQYQKNMGSSAYVRVMGYSFYSDWLQTAPNFAGAFVTGYGYFDTGFGAAAADYELSAHTRGVQIMGADQINAQNLLTFTGNYTTATVVRWNNQWYAAPGSVTNFVDGAGNCYSLQTGAASNCLLGSTAGTYGDPTGGYSTSSNAFVGYPTSNPCAAPAGNTALAGSAACKAGAQTVVTVPGSYGTLNNVIPQFSNVALQDEWRPTDRWDLNVGARFESYVYQLPATNSPENTFWFNQAANAYCYDPKTQQPILIPVAPGSSPSQAGPVVDPNVLYNASGLSPGLCYTTNSANKVVALLGPSGQQARHPNGLNGSGLFTAAGPSGFSHPLWSPRIGGTYSFGPDDVLRFSYGRYTQPTETAFEQYVNASGLGMAKFDFQHFWGLGFTTPAHDNPVQTSNNADLSYEKHLKGTDWTMKVSPFWRWTQNQLVTVSLGGSFASGINAATQRTYGVELAIQKGDPSRNGLSGQLSYTYTNAKIRYNNLANGSNAIDVINSYVDTFNALTKGGGGSQWYCANGAGPNGTNGPSATRGGCGPSKLAIRNPYYNYPVQNPLTRTDWYDVYANNPPDSAPDIVAGSAIVPNAFSGFLNYRRNRFTATLDGIMNEGLSYGSPLAVVGLDPRTCTANQGHTVPGSKGTPTAAFANYQDCNFSSFAPSGYLAIPDPAFGRFDGMGEFRQPWQLNLGMNLGYDVTPRIHATVTLANILNRCFGGSAEPWTSKYRPNSVVCGYLPNGFNYIGGPPGQGFYFGPNGHSALNGTAGYPGWIDQQYTPASGALPFQAYVNFQVKI